MKRIAACLTAVIAGFSATQAYAAQQGEMYVRGDIGYVFGDESVDGDIFEPGDHDASTDGGWRGSAAFGYLLESDLRVEAEIAYADRDTSDGQLFGDPLPTVSGSVSAWMVTANLVYDIPHKLFGAQPFIGGGVGWISVDVDYTSDDALTITVDDTDTQAVGKVFAGFALPVADHVEATFIYQYAGTFNDLRLPTGPANAPIEGTFKTPYGENSLSLGIRFTF